MKIKTALSLLTVLALFFFGSEESRSLIFRTPTEYFYGEVFLFSDSEASYFVAKNVGDSRLTIGQGDSAIVRSMDLSDGTTNVVVDRVHSNTLSLVTRKPPLPPSGVHVDFGSRSPTNPKQLHVMTEVEAATMYAWPIVLLFLAIVLTYLINDFSWQCGTLMQDTEEVGEES